jgi:hypothetical protein
MANEKFEAYLGYYNGFWTYLKGYKSAFDVLFKKIQSNHGNANELIYPALFIARHCMELGFKANIRYFIAYSGRRDLSSGNTHNLPALFKAFKLHVESTKDNLEKDFEIEVDKEDWDAFLSYCNEVDKLTSIFHELDIMSDSFRYPVAKNNSKSFEPHAKVNLIDVEKLLEISMVLFNHTSSVFSKYLDYAKHLEEMVSDLHPNFEEEMNRIYADEMRKMYEA